jgi:hypothetical protein
MSSLFSPKELICLMRLLPPEPRKEILDTVTQKAIDTKYTTCFMSPKDLITLMTILSSETQKEILDTISDKAIDIIKEKVCPICYSNIDTVIPVRMSYPSIYCIDCGDHSNCFACLGCIHTWLQLNKEPSQRELRKHLICNKVIETQLIYNTLMAYTIDEHLIDYLDRHIPVNVNCKCGLEDTRRNILNHIVSGACLSLR